MSKKIIGLLLIVLMVCFVGCAFFRGLWDGLAGNETGSQKSAQSIDQTITKIQSSIKDTGQVDVAQLIALLSQLKDYKNQNEAEKPNYLELLGAMVGIAAGTYLGTRKIRTSKVGSFISSLLSVFSAQPPKKSSA